MYYKLFILLKYYKILQKIEHLLTKFMQIIIAKYQTT